MTRALSRLAGMAVTLLAASLTIYAALDLIPGNAAARLAGSRATAATIAEVAHRHGLDRPFLPRYLDWLSGFVRGDFGISLEYRQSVSSLLAPRLGETVTLVAYAALLIAVGGLVAGIAGAVSRRAATVLTVLSGVGVAVPTFVAAALLVQVFALWLGWFPAVSTGAGPFQRFTLPAVALALSWAAYLSQVVRATLREEMVREHVSVARGRGFTEVSIFTRHVVRTAAPTLVTLSGLTTAGLLAGAVVVEQAFGLGGVGEFLIKSVQSKDSSVVLAISVLMVAVYVVVTTLADLVHAALDPRVRA